MEDVAELTVVLYQSTDVLAADCFGNVVWIINAEYQQRDMVVLAQRSRSAVHHLQVLLQHLHKGQGVVLYSVWILLWIAVINTVYHCCFQDDVCFDLCRTQRCCCIGGEERITGTAAKNNHAAVFQMLHCLLSSKYLSYTKHLYRCFYAAGYAHLLQHFANAQRIDDGCQHPHAVDVYKRQEPEFTPIRIGIPRD